jgi:hypothetical protein
VTVPLIVAGSLAILGAAIHGAGGEVLVVSQLSPGMLPSSRFGGPRTTKLTIHTTWPLTTIAFLTLGLVKPDYALWSADCRMMASEFRQQFNGTLLLAAQFHSNLPVYLGLADP